MDYSFTIAGQKETYSYTLLSETITPVQKKVIRWKIAEKLPSEKLPLHSCLVVKDNKGILICGESGAGKSTLGKFFESMGYEIHANDFVVAWISGDKLVAGGLDLQEKNKKRFTVEIANVFFITPNDKRDIYKCTLEEARVFYSQIMKPWEDTVSQKFTSYEIFELLFQKHVCLGNKVDVTRWQNAVRYVQNKRSMRNVGVIGIGSLGQEIANSLTQQARLHTLNLFSRNVNRVKSIVMDLQSAKHHLNIKAHETPHSCISESDILIFSFRPESAVHKETKEEKINAQAKIVWEYTRILRQLEYKGVVLVLSNPVDILSNLVYTFSNMSSPGIYDWKGLYSNQVYGVGLGLDYTRLKTFTKEYIEIFGEHNDKVVLTKITNSRPELFQDETLLEKISRYSEEVRRFTDRTIFGPARETYDVVSTLMADSSETLRLASLNKMGGFIGYPYVISSLVPESFYNLSTEMHEIVSQATQLQHAAMAQVINSISDD